MAAGDRKKNQKRGLIFFGLAVIFSCAAWFDEHQTLRTRTRHRPGTRLAFTRPGARLAFARPGAGLAFTRLDARLAFASSRDLPKVLARRRADVGADARTC